MLLQTYISNRIYDDNEIMVNNDNAVKTNCYDDNVIGVPKPKVWNDLSRRLFTDEVVLNVVNEWNTDPRVLYTYARRHGVDALMIWIRDVYDGWLAQRIDQPGRYLVRCLKAI